MTAIRIHWAKIAPQWVAANTWPALIRGDRLVLNVQDNQWLHELNYWRQELLTRLANQIPKSGIVRIEAFLGPVPALGQRGEVKTELPTPPPKPEIQLSEVPPRATMEALNAVQDPDLRNILAAARMHLGQPRLSWGGDRATPNPVPQNRRKSEGS